MPRRYFTAALVMLFLLAGCTTAQRRVSNHERRIPAIELSTGDIFGKKSPSQIDLYMQQVSELGIGIIRTDLKWSDAVRNSVSSFNWDAASAVIDAAARHGLLIHAIIDSPPAWDVAVSCLQPWKCAPFYPEGLAVFAAALVARFKSRLVTAEVLNEPNALPDYARDPARYAQLYRVVYNSVKAVAPALTIEPGGTAAIGTSGPDGLSAPDWYHALYAQGLGPQMDLLSVHPYTWPATPADHDTSGNWAQLEQVLTIARSNGDPHKQLDLNEVGFPTGGGDVTPAADRFPRYHPGQPVTEANQALFFKDVFSLFEQQLRAGTAARIGVYTLQDNNSGDTVGPESHFGISLPNGTPKPAWQVVRLEVKQLG